MREFDVITRIRQENTGLGDSVVIPPGDDLGAVRLCESGGVVLAGVDQVIAGVHLAETATPERFAWKVAARSLSDVAAMAACPAGMVVAAALSPAIETEWATRFSSELQRIGHMFECPLIGGDIAVLPTVGDSMVFSSTVLATPDPQVGHRLVLRSGARPGDLVCVSGEFGGSLDSDGAGHHQEFIPRIDVARKLHRSLGSELTSMIDVSDGLSSELSHLSRESMVRIVIHGDRVPRRHDSNLKQALCDGEDYELCFTVSSTVDLPASIAEVPLTVIGTVEQGEGVLLKANGVEAPLAASGWEHQARPAPSGDSELEEEDG